MKNWIKLIIFITAIPCHPLYSQNAGNLQQDLSNAMLQQAKATYKGGTSKFKNYCKQQPKQMLEALKTYETDSVVKVRSFAYSLVNFVAKNTTDSILKLEAIATLAVACGDNDYGVKTSAAKYLQNFKKAHFTVICKKTLGDIFENNPTGSKHIARLLGFLDMKDQIPALKQLANDNSLVNREKWEGWLALARMGDKEAMEYVMKMIKTVPAGDDLMYQFAPDLIYTRQHAAFDFLIEILNSDKKDCTSSNPDASGNILCGYRAMEYLAPVVEGFPLKTHASGDIDAKDYKVALQTVRQWFKQKKGKYVIKTDTF